MSLVSVVRPAAGEPQGALVLMHGRGASEHDLFGLLDLLDPERRLLGVTPGGPLTNVPPGGRHWYVVHRVGFPEPATFQATYAQLGEFVDGLLAEHGLTHDRLVVGGFSQGGVMAYSIGLGTGRPVPAGIAAMSCFVPQVDGWSAGLQGRAGLPVHISHGSQDPVIGVELGRAAGRGLTDAGLDVTYREDTAGHWVEPGLIEDLAAWLTRAIP